MLRLPFLHRFGSASLSASRITTILSTITIAACSSSATTANGGAAASVIPWSGQDQVAPVGTALGSPIQVRVTDAAGNSVIGATVTFTTTAGTLAATTGTSGVEGIFQTTFTTGTKSGTDTVTVTVNGVSTPAVFLFTATPGDPAQLAILAGNNQAATAGAALATPLQVEVQDAYGNPVPNTLVVWSADNGTLTTTTTTTDNNGIAQVAFTLGATPGTDNVTVDAGQAPPKSFVENAN
jgi:adhesin/invasin